MAKPVTSPHLLIYKPQLTSALSIFHRFSGLILLFGMVLLSVILMLVAFAPVVWDAIVDDLPSWLQISIVAPFILSAIYHWVNGIRHLSWDMGWGLELSSVYCSGYFSLGCTALLFALFWYLMC